MCVHANGNGAWTIKFCTAQPDIVVRFFWPLRGGWGDNNWFVIWEITFEFGDWVLGFWSINASQQWLTGQPVDIKLLFVLFNPKSIKSWPRFSSPFPPSSNSARQTPKGALLCESENPCNWKPIYSWNWNSLLCHILLFTFALETCREELLLCRRGSEQFRPAPKFADQAVPLRPAEPEPRSRVGKIAIFS